MCLALCPIIQQSEPSVLIKKRMCIATPMSKHTCADSGSASKSRVINIETSVTGSLIRLSNGMTYLDKTYCNVHKSLKTTKEGTQSNKSNQTLKAETEPGL